jgi:hypothetical protein
MPTPPRLKEMMAVRPANPVLTTPRPTYAHPTTGAPCNTWHRAIGNPRAMECNHGFVRRTLRPAMAGGERR